MIDHIFVDVEFCEDYNIYQLLDEQSNILQCMAHIKLFLNGKPCDTFISYDILNYKKDKWLTNYTSLPQDESFFPFTCDCDEPGCAGFHSTASFKKENGLIYWSFDSSEKKAISIAGKQHFIFNEEQYNNQMISCIEKINKESLKWNPNNFLINGFCFWHLALSHFQQ